MATLISCLVIEVEREFEVKGPDETMVKHDRVYRFEVPIGAPFGEANDVALEVSKIITQLAANAEEQAKAKAAETSAA